MREKIVLSQEETTLLTGCIEDVLVAVFSGNSAFELLLDYEEVNRLFSNAFSLRNKLRTSSCAFYGERISRLSSMVATPAVHVFCLENRKKFDLMEMNDVIVLAKTLFPLVILELDDSKESKEALKTKREAEKFKRHVDNVVREFTFQNSLEIVKNTVFTFIQEFNKAPWYVKLQRSSDDKKMLDALIKCADSKTDLDYLTRLKSALMMDKSDSVAKVLKQCSLLDNRGNPVAGIVFEISKLDQETQFL